jgi:hypothetical protein
MSTNSYGGGNYFFIRRYEVLLKTFWLVEVISLGIFNEESLLYLLRLAEVFSLGTLGLLQDHMLRQSDVCGMNSDFDNILDNLCDTISTLDFNEGSRNTKKGGCFGFLGFKLFLKFKDTMNKRLIQQQVKITHVVFILVHS